MEGGTIPPYLSSASNLTFVKYYFYFINALIEHSILTKENTTTVSSAIVDGDSIELKGKEPTSDAAYYQVNAV